MATQTFKISLPSIPGKPIRLRVQDITEKGFLVQQQRFSSDRSKLIKQFTKTFDNLRQPEPSHQDQQQKQTRSTASTHHSEPAPVRYIIPQYKNVLMDVLRRQEMEMMNGKSQQQTRPKRVISQIGQLSAQYISVEQRLQRFKQKEKGRQQFIENYYYVAKHLEDEERIRRKKLRQKPSPAFMSESRDRIQQRQILTDDSLGPGYYPLQPEENYIQNKEVEPIKEVRLKLKKTKPEIQDGNNLKKHTAKIFEKHKIAVMKQEREEQKDQQRSQKHQQQHHMFIRDDRDRFGEQIFPIVLKTNVPGPGAYEVAQTIEEKAKKINTLQEQRKLLKEWFNQ